jgi:hypothetical protein
MTGWYWSGGLEDDRMVRTDRRVRIRMIIMVRMLRMVWLVFGWSKLSGRSIWWKGICNLLLSKKRLFYLTEGYGKGGAMRINIHRE